MGNHAKAVLLQRNHKFYIATISCYAPSFMFDVNIKKKNRPFILCKVSHCIPTTCFKIPARSNLKYILIFSSDNKDSPLHNISNWSDIFFINYLKIGTNFIRINRWPCCMTKDMKVVSTAILALLGFRVTCFVNWWDDFSWSCLNLEVFRSHVVCAICNISGIPMPHKIEFRSRLTINEISQPHGLSVFLCYCHA